MASDFLAVHFSGVVWIHDGSDEAMGGGDFFFPLLRLGSPIPLADDKLTTSLWFLFQKCPKDIPIVFFLKLE